MYKKKLKDIKEREIIFLKNYNIDELLKKNKSFNYAWQRGPEIPVGIDKGKILILRFKNCAQRVMNAEETVYTITE